MENLDVEQGKAHGWMRRLFEAHAAIELLCYCDDIQAFMSCCGHVQSFSLSEAPD